MWGVAAVSDILFVRHAATEMAGRFCGHSDPDLNSLGQAQLADLIVRLSGERLERVYSSDLKRARSTAQAIADAHGVAVETSTALREIHFGEWEGLLWEQIERRDPDYAQAWMSAFPHLPAPSGETFPAFEARVLREVTWLLDRVEGPMAVVTHSGVLRVVLQHLCGRSASEAWQETESYCCVVRYEAQRGLTVIGENR
jgi:broad specificity phosphatase PhoE